MGPSRSGTPRPLPTACWLRASRLWEGSRDAGHLWFLTFTSNHKFSSPVTPATSQEHKSHVWLLAAVVDSVDIAQIQHRRVRPDSDPLAAVP